MRYGIISDIHSNLEAFQAVLLEMKKEKTDKYLFLGDLVGYGANPNECAELFLNLDSQAVFGNHDFASLHKMDLDYFNPDARSALEWTINKLSYSTINLLSSFKLKIENANYTLVHANPYSPESWDYILSMEEAHTNFSYFFSSICFVAHSHIPWIIGMSEKNETVFENKFKIYKLQHGWHYIINSGSVGQPRDHNWHSCFMIWDTKEQTIIMKRIKYDVALAQKKIMEAGLPVFLAKRLALGV